MEIRKGLENRPVKVGIFGVEGIGKSTTASKFADPLFLDTEGGTGFLDVRRVKVNSWDMLLTCLDEIKKDPSICQTVVVDTVDWAETLCIKFICEKYRQPNIESFAYGRGYTILADEFKRLLDGLDELVKIGITPVLLAHSKRVKVELPEQMDSYDKYELKLTRQCAPLVKEWLDMLLFANYKTFIVVQENGTKKAQGGKRVLYTSHTPIYDAKNRFGLPEEVDLNFDSIAFIFKYQSNNQNNEIKAQKSQNTADTKESDLLTKVKNLLATNNVQEAELEMVVAQRGKYPEGTKLSEYPEDFLARWVIPNFNHILNQIKSNKGDSF